MAIDDRGGDLDPVVQVDAVLLVQLDDVVQHDVGLGVRGPARGDGERPRSDLEGVPEAEADHLLGRQDLDPHGSGAFHGRDCHDARGHAASPLGRDFVARRVVPVSWVPWVHETSASAWPRCRTAAGWRTPSTGTGPPLLVAPGWLSHLELGWAIPAERMFHEALSSGRTLVRYDRPGCGLSDPYDGPADHGARAGHDRAP